MAAFTWTAGSSLWGTAANWDAGAVPNSTSAIVTVDNSGTATISGGVLFSVGTLTIGTGRDTSAVAVGDNSALLVAASIVNNNTLSLTNAGNTTELRINGGATVTLSGGGTVLMGGLGPNTLIRDANLGTGKLVNVDNTISGRGNIGNGQLALDNQAAGIIDATSFLGLTLQSNSAGFTNEGLIEATNTGLLTLSATNLVQTGGTVLASGTGASVHLQNGATIAGGTIATAGGGTMVTSNGVIAGLDNLTLTPGSTFTGNDNSATYLIGTILNQGTLALNSAGNSTDFRIAGGQTLTLSGGGVVNMGGIAGHDLIHDADNATGMLVNVDNTIQGSGSLGNNQLSMDNQAHGTIDANSAGGLTIEMNATGMTNESLIQASGGGALSISGAGGGAIAQSPAGTILAAGAGSSVSLTANAAISGGTLSTTGGGTMSNAAAQSAALSNVTLTAGSTFTGNDNSSTYLIGTIVNQGTLALNSAGNAADYRLAGGQTLTLTGGGVVNMGGSVGHDMIHDANNATGQLINIDNTIQGSGGLGTGQLTMDNQAGGIVDADISGASLTVEMNSAGMTNEGLLEATGGGGLAINGSDGGAFVQSGTGAIAAGAGSSVSLTANAAIAGGTLSTTGGGTMSNAAGQIGTLSNVTLTAGSTFTGNDNSATYLIGTIVNQGTLALNSAGNATDYRLGGGQTLTLTGGGIVNLGGATTHDLIRDANSGTGKLVNAGNTIEGAGNVGNAQMTMDDQASGIVSANVSGQTLLLQMNAAGMTNEGTLQAIGGGILLVSGSTITNTGTIQALNGSAVAFAANATNNSVSSGTLTAGTWAAISTGGGATLTASGGPVTTNAATITLSGTGSAVQFSTLFTNENIESSLTTNAAAGVLNVINGQNFGSPVNLANDGRINLGGGTFSDTDFNNPGTVFGYGTLTGTTLNNTGGLVAAGGTLVLSQGVTGAGGVLTIDPAASMKVAAAVTGSQSFTVQASGTLELASSAVAQTRVVLPGAASRLNLDAPTLFAGTVDMGAAFGGTIDLAGIAAATPSYNAGTSAWSVSFTGGAITVIDTPAHSKLSTASDGAGGTLVSVSAACFVTGTRIAAAGGETPIETLRIGDRVINGRGESRPVKWIGTRRVDCRAHPRPRDVWPVRVAAGAFGDGVPCRDLRLSPDHAVFIDGVLIPVRYLVNGRTIAQEKCHTVTYWHVELDMHDIILAEQLPCESYLDTGNRGAFANGGPAVQMHPDFALRIWDTQACARLVCDGASLIAARSILLERAAERGHRVTASPSLRVIGGGRTVWPVIIGRVHRFHLPAAAGGVRVMSRSAVPMEMHDDGADPRRLGVAVSCIALDGAVISLTDPRLGKGWHEAEYDAGLCGPAWRWTDGDAALAAESTVLDITVAMTGRYWLDGPYVAAEVANGSMNG